MKLCEICGEPIPENAHYNTRFCNQKCREQHEKNYSKQWNKKRYATIKLLRTMREERIKELSPEQIIALIKRGEQ